MTDAKDDKSDMQAPMPLRLNPEALDKVSEADRKGIDQVRTVVRHAPWHKRLIEDVGHHLLGEAAGIAIGAALVIGGVIAPRSPPSVFPDPVCLVQVTAQGPAQRTIYRLIPCPPLEDISQASSSGDGSG
jgi:hypothetical protein